MSSVRSKLRDAVGKVFSLSTGESHKLTLLGPSVHVLDIEDSHFNFDRRVLLPDLPGDGSPPTLDTRRLTGLGVIYAALFHAKTHSAQGLFVSGHTDASGAASYNQKLSEDRAQNVSLLLRGDREAWRKLSAHDDAVDDVQSVLAWQHERAGWDCDPGAIDNKNTPRFRKAVGRFQELYNGEVEKASKDGLDSPFKKKIAVDKTVGGETWGAVYDLYMSELMDLLEITKYSELQPIQAALKSPPGMPAFVGCGEHIPFTASRRNEFEKGTDEHLEGPQTNPPDRRVELLFFDPGEELDLVCHKKPGKCEPAECPLYMKVPPRQNPIGIPKGLPLAEVNLRLTFVDPEGKVRPFPEGLEVEAKFAEPTAATDGESDSEHAKTDPESMEEDEEPNELVGPDGVLQFVIPRKASRLFLHIHAGADCFITADRKELNKQKLANRDEAMDDVGAGRVFFMLPPELSTKESYFDVPAPAPAGVTFKDGCFQDLDNKKTQIGSREAPVELRLTINWQHFKFEYFDRWTSSLTQVAQSRTEDESKKPVPPLVMEGVSSLIEADASPTSEVQTAWDIQSGKNTVHCLGWVQKIPAQGEAPERKLPDDKCTARFRTKDLFVRTEGDGSSPDAARNFVELPAGDPARDTPNAERLRLYDLPEEWRSRTYPARVEGEATDKIRDFEELAAKPSALDKPYVFSLDAIVMENDAGKPDLTIKWDDTDVANRFALFDHQLKVHKPDPPSGEPYFTKLLDLKPPPKGPVLSDLPPFTRLIARNSSMYDVFAKRTRAIEPFKGAPVGARVAQLMSTAEKTLAATLYAKPFSAPRALAADSRDQLGDGFAAFLRCCGHDKNIELFHVIQFLSVSFTYPSAITADEVKTYPLLANAVPFPAPPPNAIPLVRDCLLKISERWNGASDTIATIELGTPVTARGQYRALLMRGARSAKTPAPSPEVRINVLQKQRAFMDGTLGYWQVDDLKPADNGYFVAAHEFGHVFSHPDEYINRDYLPSLEQPNIGERSRSPGAPYGLDDGAMMNNNREVRARYFWDLLLFAHDKTFFKDAAFAIKRGGKTFAAEITKPPQSRVRFPQFKKENVSFAGLGLCDLFVYVTGHDQFTSDVDGFVVVRVKMAWDITTTTAFDDLRRIMNRANATIRNRFNDTLRVALRAKVGGRDVRLRLFFAPRFTCSTFPQGGDSAKYLATIQYPALPTPFTAADYTSRVTSDIGTYGVHVNVRLAAGAPGSVTAGTPRQAVVRNDGSAANVTTNPQFDDTTTAMFGRLVGSVTGGAPHSPADFKPLADVVMATFPEITAAVPVTV